MKNLLFILLLSVVQFAKSQGTTFLYDNLGVRNSFAIGAYKLTSVNNDSTLATPLQSAIVTPWAVKNFILNRLPYLWGINGNSNVSVDNFIGPINNVGFRIRTNNLETVLIDSIGRVTIRNRGISRQNVFRINNFTGAGIFNVEIDQQRSELSFGSENMGRSRWISAYMDTLLPAIYYAGLYIRYWNNVIIDNYSGEASSPAIFTVRQAGAGAIPLLVVKGAGPGRGLYLGDTTNQASSALTITSTTKGILIPRMNTAQMNAVVDKAPGLIVYCTDSLTLCRYDAGAWRIIGSIGGSGIFSSHVIFSPDNTYNIGGASGANRPANIYLGNFLSWGTSSASPMLKKVTAALQVRGGDDAGFWVLESSNLRYGAGSPEGVVSSPVGSLFGRSDGGTGTSLYLKQSGSGNTGWASLAAVISAMAAAQISDSLNARATEIDNPNLGDTLVREVGPKKVQVKSLIKGSGVEFVVTDSTITISSKKYVSPLLSLSNASLTWNSTAPSGTPTHSYQYTIDETGKEVNVWIYISYTAGTATSVNQVDILFPGTLPLPQSVPGFTSTGAIPNVSGDGFIYTQNTNVGTDMRGRSYLKWDGTNWYICIKNVTSYDARFAWAKISYITAP